MKKKSLIPQYLQDELSNLVQKKDAYTEEERGSRHHQPDADGKAVHHTGNHKRCHALLGTREGKTQ